MSQNIYDNETFFQEYKELRKNVYNYNILVEQPAIRKLLPDLSGKIVLDLGCGYGNNCIDFISKGASKVVGIDISSKMLEIAKKENIHENIKYIQMDMSKINILSQKFDLIFSSLAFHYVEDYKKLICDIRLLLKDNGTLLYSQEHPNTTAPKKGCVWTKDQFGNKLYSNLSDYMYSGKRKITWLNEKIEKYHRPMSEIINTLIKENFIIKELVEPIPDENALKKRPDFIDEFHRTTCVIIKAQLSH
ncbi:class I SAM-dependent methyltransferase [Clostridium lundense]|uniref:class I SAM-dependent methyltransferase n=1 Tax=Clostridium lundense TaxID=319475 RepID=UPI00048A3877|nr:class I SAM-dependent methyltransferase [Clostridium lundense]